MWRLISGAFAEVDDPYRDYWAKRLWQYFCERLQSVRTEWIPFIAEFNDQQAWGKYTQPKARRYCCLVRDIALDFCLKNGLIDEERSEELWQERKQARANVQSAGDLTYLPTTPDTTPSRNTSGDGYSARIAENDTPPMK